MKNPILGFLPMAVLIGFLGATNQAQASPQARRGAHARSLQSGDPVKEAIIKELYAYFDQFKGACFAAGTFSLGDPEIFKAKIGEKLNEIIVGQKGAAEIAKMAPKSLGYHNSGEYGLFWKAVWVQLVFSFDPQTIPPGEAGYTNRQTMAHELTHHIEWLEGRKELSKIVDPKTKKKIDNPRSERNTNYQDRVVNQLWDLMVLEDPKKSNPMRKSKTQKNQDLRSWVNLLEIGRNLKPNWANY